MNAISYIHSLQWDAMRFPAQHPEKSDFIFTQLFDTLDASLPLLSESDFDEEAALENIIDTAETFLSECETMCDCRVSSRLREVILQGGGCRFEGIRKRWPFRFQMFWEHTGEDECNKCFYGTEINAAQGCIYSNKRQKTNPK